jgi:hypothetical protein
VGDSRSTVDRGLPSIDVNAIAATGDGLWVATARGVAVIPEPQAGPVLAGPPAWTGSAVRSMVAAGNELLAGSDRGIAERHTSGGVGPLVVLEESFDRVVALGAVGDTVVAVFGNQARWRTNSTDWSVPRHVDPVGAVRAIDVEAHGAWLGGDAGLGYLAFDFNAFRVILTAADLPGPVRAIEVGNGFVWGGTSRGLVRFEESALVR